MADELLDAGRFISHFGDEIDEVADIVRASKGLDNVDEAFDIGRGGLTHADEVTEALNDAGRAADNADEAALSLSRMDELMGERPASKMSKEEIRQALTRNSASDVLSQPLEVMEPVTDIDDRLSHLDDFTGDSAPTRKFVAAPSSDALSRRLDTNRRSSGLDDIFELQSRFDEDKVITFYHGTTANHISSFEQDGIKAVGGGDFGTGFYVTRQETEAVTWARMKSGMRSGQPDPYIIKVEVSESEFKALEGRYDDPYDYGRVVEDEEIDLEMAVDEERLGHPNISIDYIYGPVSGKSNYEQINFKSQRAFKRLRWYIDEPGRSIQVQPCSTNCRVWA